MNQQQLIWISVLLLAALTHPFAGVGQVLISGEVNHDNAPLEATTVKWVVGGDVVKTFLTDRKGRFEVEVDYDQQFTLIFVRPFMFPVAVDVDTRIDDPTEVESYEVPLVMTMFYRYAGMSEAHARKSIGKIAKSGTGRDAFSFTAYPESIAAVKSLAQESTEREAQGEVAIESEVFETEVPTVPLTKSLPTEKQVTVVPISKKNIPTSDNGTGKNASPADKRTLAASRNEDAAQAREIQREKQASDYAKNANNEADLQRVADDFIYVSKGIRLDYMVYQQSLAEQALANKMDKAAAMDYTVENGLYAPPLLATSVPALLKYSIENGTFAYREEVLVELNQSRIKYSKEVYHWLLFDLTYFYKDEFEITEQDYVSIKRSVGL